MDVKLATMNDGSRDGALVIVSRDLCRMVDATQVAPTLQDALERWAVVQPQLSAKADALEAGRADDEVPFDQERALAPLPRAWQWLDGSAFESHGDLMSTVFGAEKLRFDRPLMYQGISDHFYPGRSEVPMVSENFGIDFEGEFGVVLTDVPVGVSAAQANDYIALIVQINDWSLRDLGAVEMSLKFGFLQSKPACGMAPVAVTPDELGPKWSQSRVCLPLDVQFNGADFGHASGGEMAFGFDELISHAAKTRPLCAGTVVGSGTVSNSNFRQVGSSCIAERRAIEVGDTGEAHTPYMRFGDTVAMQVNSPDGTSLFGQLMQTVVRYP